jgi:hypothetical protein
MPSTKKVHHHLLPFSLVVFALRVQFYCAFIDLAKEMF